MSRIRSSFAIAAGRLAGRISRLLRLGGGTSLPGAVALKIDRGVIGKLAGRLERGTIVLTATNGKTTTANMTADILTAAGMNPVHNAAGANLAYGVASALMAAGGVGPRIGLFEVDEATVKNVLPELSPAVLAVGNIFRDQLDRFGEVDQTARLIAKGIAQLKPEASLVLNADDPRVAALGRDSRVKTVYFGLEDPGHVAAGEAGAQDSKDCLVCGGPLTYSHRYFSHLGHYGCPSCGFTRPRPDIVATDLRLSLRGSRFKIKSPAGDFLVDLPVPALYNVYNALTAAAISLTRGIEPPVIVSSLARFKPAFGRFESIEVEGRRLHLMLIKNPTAFNQAIEALNIDPSPKNVLIAINDNLADGTDVSWLWDADVERLSAAWLMAGGTRAHDMALRLKYAGVKPETFLVETDFRAALDQALKAAPAGGDLYVFPTYTAMLEIRRRLEDLGDVTAFWRPGVKA
jgi:lipid II isoglutaminyl synthase (glutamine-hydrolysing)